MKITKIGHCCLVIEYKGLTIMTDPGIFSTGQEDILGIDILLITHEHTDHLHTPSVQAVVGNNPNVRIITNESCKKLLDVLGINSEILKDGESLKIDDLTLTAINNPHEEIYKEVGLVENTGFAIDNFFYPGDAFTPVAKLKNKPKLLALPVSGPWMKSKNAIDYALSFGEITAFPVHDGFFTLENIGPFHGVPQRVLEGSSVTFVPMKPGDIMEFNV